MQKVTLKKTSQSTIDLLVGWLLYPLGDLIGQLIMGAFSLERTLCITLAGGLIYRFEVPAWFKFLEKLRASDKVQKQLPFIFAPAGSTDSHALNWLGRTLGAMLYFNPLWIARHVFIIYLATHQMQLAMGPIAAVGHFVMVGCKSFLANLPVSLVGNYIIQQKLKPEHRFFGSATLSGIFSISYAIEYVFFK